MRQDISFSTTAEECAHLGTTEPECVWQSYTSGGRPHSLPLRTFPGPPKPDTLRAQGSPTALQKASEGCLSSELDQKSAGKHLKPSWSCTLIT